MTAITASSPTGKQSLAEQLAHVDASIHLRTRRQGSDNDIRKRDAVARSLSVRSIIAESLSRQTTSKDLNIEQPINGDLCTNSVSHLSTVTTRSSYLKRKQKVSLPPVQQRYGRDLVSDWHRGPFSLSDSKITWLSQQHRSPLHSTHHKSES